MILMVVGKVHIENLNKVTRYHVNETLAELLDDVNRIKHSRIIIIMHQWI